MPTHAPKPTPEDQVRALAYQFWLEEGRPEGRAEIHWQRALESVSAHSIPDMAIPDVTPVVEVPAAAKATVKRASVKKAPAKKAVPKKK